MATLVIDAETDGLDPDIIWVLGILDYDTDEYTAYTGDDIVDGIMRMLEADCLIGHNVKAYDLFHIEKLLDFQISFDMDRVVDTLEISRELYSFDSHSLEAWGERLGLPKIKYTEGFRKFNPKMLPYCERDVRLTKRIFEHMIPDLLRTSVNEVA